MRADGSEVMEGRHDEFGPIYHEEFVDRGVSCPFAEFELYSFS